MSTYSSERLEMALSGTTMRWLHSSKRWGLSLTTRGEDIHGDTTPRPQRSQGLTIADVLSQRANESEGAPAFCEWTAEGRRVVSFRAFMTETRLAGSMFAGLGVRKGERVGILYRTSLAFEVVNCGLLSMGAVVVGLDPRESPDALQQIIRRAGITGLVVEDWADLERLEDSVQQCLRFVIMAPRSCPDSWEGAMRHGTSLEPVILRPDGPWFEPPEADDLATFVLTSGSSGEPKGYGYTHGQLIDAALSCRAALPELEPGSRLIAWLPVSALFQRMIDLVGWIAGATTYFVDDPAKIFERTRDIEPTIFFGVPRFYQKLRAGILAHAEQAPIHRRWIIRAALRTCHALGRARRQGQVDVVAELAARTVLRPTIEQLRSALGGHLRAAVTGSAPMSLDLVDEYEGMGIPILEAYGLTECILPIAMNSLSSRKSGTVGRPLAGNKVRLADDGEIEVHGPGLPCSSLDSPLPLTKDGFLKTGDIGELDADGFLRIIDRKGSMFKLATGHKVSPVAVEESLTQISWVDQAQLLGRGRTRPVAIVWVLPESAPSDERTIRERLDSAIGHIDRRLHPERYLIIRRPAGVEAGELTLTQKLRRADNERRYSGALDAVDIVHG